MRRTADAALPQLNKAYKRKIQGFDVLKKSRREFFFQEIDRIYITIKNGADNF